MGEILMEGREDILIKSHVNQCSGALVKEAKSGNFKSKRTLFKLLMQ